MEYEYSLHALEATHPAANLEQAQEIAMKCDVCGIGERMKN